MSQSQPSAAADDRSETFASIARVLEAQETGLLTLRKVVDLAPSTIPGCDDAAISLVVGSRIETPAATGPRPVAVDLLQYATGEGSCLDAIRHPGIQVTDDLASEVRWPHFSARVAAETGVRSMLSFRLFLGQSTLGSLNLYSTRVAAFGADSQSTGAVYAAHAAVAVGSAQARDQARRLALDLTASEHRAQLSTAQLSATLDFQPSMLPTLPDVAPVTVASRYLPAVPTAQVGGDWYDAFRLPGGAAALVIGDVAGHDRTAALQMGQLRTVLRALAVDRNSPPGESLRRLDTVLEHLAIAGAVTCIYGQLDMPTSAGARLRFANAGHPPPLLIAARGEAHYLQTPDHPLLGLGLDLPRSSTAVHLPAGSTLLLYTDGLIERRGENLDEGLQRLRQRGAELADAPLETLCDLLISDLAPAPDDDVCLLAVRVPPCHRNETCSVPPLEAGLRRAA